MAADAGDLWGHFALGRFYLRQKRYREARETYAIPAAAEYGPALHDMGKIYLLGLGVEKDIEKAKSYYERATKAGNLFAKAHLARLLMRHATSMKSKIRGYLLLLGAMLELFPVLIREGFKSRRLIE